ncbi:MAG: hypothetical protein ACRDWY_10400 [Actinomycetes bacterium]
MAGRDDKRNEIDKLLAEVESTLSGGPVTPAARDENGVERARRGIASRVQGAATAGLTAAVAVWLLFAILPFLRATSGAVGAFLATFVVVLVLRRR